MKDITNVTKNYFFFKVLISFTCKISNQTVTPTATEQQKSTVLNGPSPTVVVVHVSQGN